jgi:hypothetical protein
MGRKSHDRSLEAKVPPAPRWVMKCTIISVLLLIPCFWQKRIESVDLPSHIYTVWLSTLAREGKVQGVWVAHQWTNVLFDYCLDGVSSLLGYVAAQRIVVAGSVLMFFWSAFYLVYVLAGRQPWYLIPCLVMLTYGVIFHLGSFNYYLAVGLSFLALALIWQPNMWRVLVAVPLLAIAWLATPLPPLWVVCVIAYARISGRVSSRNQIILFGLTLGLLIALREILIHRFVAPWTFKQVLYITGVDQIVFGQTYHWISFLLFALWVVLFIKLVVERGLWPALSGISFQLYALCVIGAFILPTSLLLPFYAVPYGDLPQRFSILAGVLACAVLNQVRPRWWHAAAFSLVAVAFFVHSYLDDRAVNALEARIENVVAQLPAGQRVIGAFYYPIKGGQDFSAILDRACIGKCFSFGNYEPSTLQFRLRANPGNSIVAWSQLSPVKDQYFSSHPTSPLYELYRCDHVPTAICLRTW